MKTFGWAENINDKIRGKSSTDLLLLGSSILNVFNVILVIGTFLFLKFYIIITGNYEARWYVIYLLPLAIITTIFSWATGSYVLFYKAKIKNRKLSLKDLILNQLNLPFIFFVAFIFVFI